MTTLTAWGRAGALTDEIRAEARQIDPVKVGFTLLMLPFVLVGLVVAGVARVGWAVLAFAWVAILVGWRRGGGPEVARRKPGGS